MIVNFFLPLIYSMLFFRSFPNWWSFVFFVIAVSVGYQLLFFDRLLHAFYLYPDTEFNQLIHSLWKNRNYTQALKALAQAETLQEKLLTRSVLFFITYIVLMIFVMTSTGSVIGVGLMLGLGVHYLYDFWRYIKSPENFKKHYLWQLKRSVSDQEMFWFVLGWSVFFALMSMMVLF